MQQQQQPHQGVTVLAVDASAGGLESSGVELSLTSSRRVDAVSGSSGTPGQYHADKPCVSVALFAVLEYLRVLFDVFPDSVPLGTGVAERTHEAASLVLGAVHASADVVAAGETGRRGRAAQRRARALTNWRNGSQEMATVLESLASAGPEGVASRNTEANHARTVQFCVQHALVGAHQRGFRTPLLRVVVFTMPSSSGGSGGGGNSSSEERAGGVPNHAATVADWIGGLLSKKEGVSPRRINVVFVAVDPGAGDAPWTESYRDSKLDDRVFSADQVAIPLVVQWVTVAPSKLDDCSLSMLLDHMNLSRAVVTKIPMRESPTGSEVTARSHYDVPLYFPAPDECPLSELDEQALEWTVVTSKHMPMYYASPGRCVHRVSPQFALSSPTICLMKHLAAGRTVMLTAKDDDGDPGNSDVADDPGDGDAVKPRNRSADARPTHMLIKHGSDVFLHCLGDMTGFQATIASLPQGLQPAPLPSVARSHDLQALLLSQFVLRAFERPESVDRALVPMRTFSQQRTFSPAQLERATRFFPYTITRFMMHHQPQSPQLMQLLGPIQDAILDPTPSMACVSAAVASIQQLRACLVQGIVLYPNMQDQAGAINRLCAELWAVSQLLMFSSAHDRLVSVFPNTMSDTYQLSAEVYAALQAALIEIPDHTRYDEQMQTASASAAAAAAASGVTHSHDTRASRHSRRNKGSNGAGGGGGGVKRRRDDGDQGDDDAVDSASASGRSAANPGTANASQNGSDAGPSLGQIWAARRSMQAKVAGELAGRRPR